MNSAERRKIVHALRRAGFHLARTTTHTEIWERHDERSDIEFVFRMPSNGGTHDPRNAAEQRVALRRMGVEL